MKEIKRNDVKIEQICNEFDPFGQVNNQLQLLKWWPKVKAQYEKIYGLNKSSVTADVFRIYETFYNFRWWNRKYKDERNINAQLQEHQHHILLSNE